MRRTIILAGVLPFISAFLGGALAFSLVAAPQATAQSGELQEVRASAFTLVGTDGTVIATLQPGRRTGAAVLGLRDTGGTEHMAMTGQGVVEAYDLDGRTPVFKAGRHFIVGNAGYPPLNGVQLGPDGSISMIPLRP